MEVKVEKKSENKILSRENMKKCLYGIVGLGALAASSFLTYKLTQEGARKRAKKEFSISGQDYTILEDGSESMVAWQVYDPADKLVGKADVIHEFIGSLIED